MMEQTLIIVKPDGVRRGLVGAILQRFENKGLRLVDLKMVNFTRTLAEHFYSPHVGKFFVNDLVAFMASGPAAVAILEGISAVSVVRRMIGATNSAEANAGTVRGDYGLGVTDNVIHASDSAESFSREAEIVFR